MLDNDDDDVMMIVMAIITTTDNNDGDHSDDNIAMVLSTMVIVMKIINIMTITTRASIMPATIEKMGITDYKQLKQLNDCVQFPRTKSLIVESILSTELTLSKLDIIFEHSNNYYDQANNANHLQV